MQTTMPTDQQWNDAQALLGVGAQASAEEIHAAYLRLVRQHPPDRDPEEFERIRNAYDLLRDPRARARQVVLGPDPSRPLVALLDERQPQLRHVSMDLWMAALREKRT